MPSLKLTITETIEVPEGTEVVLARTGVVSGYRLPDGTFIKPWITSEIYKDPEGDPEVVNAGEDDLNELGIYGSLDFERSVEHDDDIAVDDSACQG